ncbi:uncharacterized protein LOC100168529 [Acyrthosiphon pisum]|uniref:Tc1-like transposase DDE domain-containing protein n=1 Tax=Acyrthosiphon pisum TaxID=7029 RepID=A0A8R2NVX1_ACYPI|nr:uncharacterized protein LOC100168529 [Acyrthosiphon pisum]|eukprot:XP_016662785.1 PREDICTED: uncharacterized protein LOC100168529 [Acyrthosiphon pisum]
MEEKFNAVVPVKKNPRGKFVGCQQKQMIINLYISKMSEQATLPDQRRLKYIDLIKLMSQETGIGQRTISMTLSEYKKKGTISSPNRKKVRPKLTEKVDEFNKNAIRRKIHGFWHRKEFPTFEKIMASINDDPNLSNFSRSSLQLLLKDLNFVYTKIKRNFALIERGDIVCWRQKYLESIRYYRSHDRQIYYLDESWINVEESAKSVDTTIQSGQKNLSGKGKQLIVVHIGSSDGFVPGGLWYFESKNNSSDYHDEINDVTFYEWFSGIISLLEDNAVIVMDTASYHSVQKDTFPLVSWEKSKIIKWLEDKGKLIHRPMVKHQLLEEAEQFRPICEKYVIDELAKENNKIVLRLPPYHSELNPMELAWSFVKRYVKTNNTTFKLPDVQKLLHEGVELVTPQLWKNFINQVIKEEDQFFEIDFITDELLEAELMEPNTLHYVTIKGDISESGSEFDD